MINAKVSVVIITKNEGETIEKCLKSVVNQSVKPLEVIIVDGRSTDDTLERARQFKVKVLVETGQTSPSNARNLGVENAQGEIVLIMGADTELDNDCIRNAMEYFQKPEVLVVIPSLEIRVHTRLEGIQKKWFYGTRSRLRTKHGTGSSIQFIRRDIYLRVKFDPNFGFGDDSDFRRRLEKIYESQGIVKARNSKIFVDLPHTFSEFSSQYLWYGRTAPTYFARYHSIGRILNLGSLLMPSLLLISFVALVILPSAIYLLIPILVLFIARNIIACIRSKSTYFLEFLLFDFARSLLYISGLAKGIFTRKTGR